MMINSEHAMDYTLAHICDLDKVDSILEARKGSDIDEIREYISSLRSERKTLRKKVKDLKSEQEFSDAKHFFFGAGFITIVSYIFHLTAL